MAGYESVGMKHQCALNRNKLLVDRAPQLIKSFVKKDDVALEDASCKALLEGPYTLPSSVAACTTCQKPTPTHLPRCGHCGVKNERFSSAACAVAKGGKAAGYTKQTDVFDVDAHLASVPEDTKAERFAFMGDLLQEMRGRKRKAVLAAEGPVFLALTEHLFFEACF